MGGKWTQGRGKRAQGEESVGEGRETGFENTLSNLTLLVMSDIKPRTILGESRDHYLICYFEVSVGWNTKAVHLFATASELAIGGINLILVKGQKSSPLKAAPILEIRSSVLQTTECQ